MASSSAELAKLVDTVLTAAKAAEAGDTAEKSRALDGLKALRALDVSVKALSDTGAGKRVRGLSKHPSPELAAAAAAVVAAWKATVTAEGAGTSGSAGLPRPASAAKLAKALGSGALPAGTSQASQGSAGGASTAGAAPAKTSAAAAPAAAPAPAAVAPTGDELRDKCRGHLAATLRRAADEGATPAEDPSVLAAAVESALFASCGGTSAAYKTKFRQLHFNLKDDKNPDLRRKVATGEIQPAALVDLPPEELASDAKREENARIRERKLFDSAPSSAKQATTDQFQCGKCRQRKCTYYQMQTRSADEPMTTFVTCLNCNNRWKFC